MELLIRPRVLFLDEPTSGLDPAAGAALLKLLRGLAHQGTTIVLTTHTPADLLRADTVAFLSPDGRLVYRGAPDGLLKHFGTDSVEEAYGAAAEAPSVPAESESAPESDHDYDRDRELEALGAGSESESEPGSEPEFKSEAERESELEPESETESEPESEPESESAFQTGLEGAPRADTKSENPMSSAADSATDPKLIGPLRQWWLLTRRSAEILARNRLSAAVLVGSPLVIIAMFAMLFRPGPSTRPRRILPPPR
ncbi:AAA family ATPase [Catenulispora yoronensis]